MSGFTKEIMMRRANGDVAGWALAAACVAATTAHATMTPTVLFGDSYIVREGGHNQLCLASSSLCSEWF